MPLFNNIEVMFIIEYYVEKANDPRPVFRPANSHGFAACLTVLAPISCSHEFLFISHGFSKAYFQFINAAIFKMFRFYSAFPLQILYMILCTISLFCVIVLESHRRAADIAGSLL